MKLIRLIAIGCSALALASCSTVTGMWGNRSSVKVSQGDTYKGTLFVWSADANAGVMNAEGKFCIQRAQAIKSLSSKTEAQLSDAILKAFSAAAATANVTPQNLASLMSEVSEIATTLSTSTERTAFLDIGMFYTCQLAANNNITDVQAEAIVKQFSTDASAIIPVQKSQPAK